MPPLAFSGQMVRINVLSRHLDAGIIKVNPTYPVGKVVN